MAEPFVAHPWQLAAVDAYFDRGGVFIGLEPGAGKTYVAAQIARRCPRPVVLAPASVIPQTRRMFESYGVPTFEAKDDAWPAPGSVAFASYTWLTRSAQADFFERYRPSDLLMDEFHEIRNLGGDGRKPNTAATRTQAYLVANPAVRCGVFSASLVTDRFTDFAHGCTWALRGGVRGLIPPTRAGVLARAEEFAANPEAWRAFLTRLASVPGVFLDSGDPAYRGAIDISVTRRAPVLELPDTWELPDGWALGSAAEAAGAEKCLAWGFYLQTLPRPSEAFMEARRAWAAVVRRCVASDGTLTESQVRAMRPEAWAAYAAAAERDGERTRWHTAQWPTGPLRLDPVPPGTIVWAYHRELQEAAAAALGCPWHGARGLDADGVRLDETTAPVVVASIEACSAGFNAQAFHHNVVLEPPSDPEVWRQLIGRTARQGQTARRVTFDIILNCKSSENALRTAIQRAKIAGKRNPLTGLCLD